MLTELVVQNFAIIDRLQVPFGPGFNVLTGETGAGKSIIIDAVGLLLGDRARPDLIRTGEDEATVEGRFDVTAQPEMQTELRVAGFEIDGELVVKRVVTRAGKNRVYLNGSLARLGQLQELTESLVNIYGQHEHQALQRTEAHLALLDGFAETSEALSLYAGHYAEVRELQQRRDGLQQATRERSQRLDFLQFQLREIDAANLQAGEDEELERERRLLLAGEKLTSAVNGGYQVLYAGDGAVCEQLERVAADLEGVAQVEARLGDVGVSVRNALLGLEDAALELRDFSREIDFEPGRQEEVEQRLVQLAELKRKFAPTLVEILARREQLVTELAELENAGELCEELGEVLRRQEEALQRAGEKLSALRQEAATRLAASVEQELAELALGQAKLEVRFFALDEPGPHGLERVEFYLSPNPGEELRPLAWIASGGELSRIMLAMRRVAPDADQAGTLIFDEVDAGVGGQAATAIGEKLRTVGEGRQVLCITHLPQVAAFADAHYRVEKMVDQGRTFTALVFLNDEMRVQEMARMLGGAKVTEQTLDHARELIATSRTE